MNRVTNKLPKRGLSRLDSWIQVYIGHIGLTDLTVTGLVLAVLAMFYSLWRPENRRRTSCLFTVFGTLVWLICKLSHWRLRGASKIVVCLWSLHKIAHVNLLPFLSVVFLHDYLQILQVLLIVLDGIEVLLSGNLRLLNFLCLSNAIHPLVTVRIWLIAVR